MDASLFDPLSVACTICGQPARYGDLLFLDWGERGTVNVFLVAACIDAAHQQQVREEVVKTFQSRQGSARNGFLGGSIIHVVPLSDSKPEAGHRVILWSDSKEFRGWKSAWRIWDIVLNRRNQTEAYRRAFRNPRFINRVDWRGWSKSPSSGLPEKYQLLPLTTVAFGSPMVYAFATVWAKQLPDPWKPEIERRLPDQILTVPPQPNKRQK